MFNVEEDAVPSNARSTLPAPWPAFGADRDAEMVGRALRPLLRDLALLGYLEDDAEERE